MKRAAGTRLLVAGSVIGVAAVLTISGCAEATSGVGTRASGRSSVSTSAAGPSLRAGSAPVSLTRLDSIVVRASDLSSDWEDEHDGDNAGSDVDIDSGVDPADIPECSGLAAIEVRRVAEGDSDDFTDDTMTVWSSVTSYASTDDVVQLQKYILSPDFPSCQHQLDTKEIGLLGAFGATATGGNPVITPETKPAGLVAISRATLNLTVATKPVTLYNDTAYITSKQIAVTVEFTGIGAPVPAATESQVISLVAARATE